MRMQLALFATPLLLAACAQPMGPRGAEDNRARSFNALPLPSQVFADPDAVVTHYLAERGVALPTTRLLDNDPDGEADAVLLFSAEGYADDALAGEQWRMALDRTEAGYRVIEAGVRYRCYRAEPGRWRLALCP